jgi:hypothetical protein
VNQYEREEDQLERDLREGLISQAEYNKQLRDMQRDYADEMRGLAEDAAERAYNDTMGEWS